MSSDRRRSPALFPLLVLAALCVACPGAIKEQPPIHLIPNMDHQDRRDAQEAEPFFADGRAMRPRVEGTIPRGSLGDDMHRDQGKNPDGSWAEVLPRQLELTRSFVERGQQRYEIYCAPCHDSAGSGQGPAVQRGMLRPPSLHDDRLRAMALGEFHDIITNGVRNMPAYGRIPTDDRWAIAVWVRTLQVSQNATFEDVPRDVARAEGWSQP
ncbi:MAG: cytochrome c [Acidobacteriota bacterium]